MEKLLSDEKYAFVNQKNKDFIVAFNTSMIEIGYANNSIQPYVVFGKYKIEYYKPGNKIKKYIARFYFRDDDIVLRLYLSNIDRHADYIEKSPDFIKKPFVDSSHTCKKPDCKGMGSEPCRYRKIYTIDGVTHIKCAEQSFCFYEMDAQNASTYVELLTTFYPDKKRKGETKNE